MNTDKERPPLFWQTGRREIPPRPDNPRDYPPEDERHWFDLEYAGWLVRKEPQPVSPADGPKGKNIIALVAGDHPYSEGFRRGMSRTADKFGIRLTFFTSDWDPDLQEQQVERAVQLKPDLVILCADSVRTSTGLIRRIYDAGIPVIAGNLIPEDKGFRHILAWTGPDDWSQFRLLSRRFAALMKSRGGYAIICHREDTSAYYARSWSAVTELKKAAPDMELLAMSSTDLNREKTCELVKQWLEEFGDRLKGIISADDSVTQLGINQAVAEAGREDIIRVANGSTPTGIRLVREGRLDAITFQMPEQDGALPVQVAVDWFNGLEIPPMRHLPVRLLDRDNIDLLLTEPEDMSETDPDYLYQMIMECRTDEVFRYFRRLEEDFSRSTSISMEFFRGYSIEVLSNLMNIIKTRNLPADAIIGNYEALFKKLFQQPTMEKTLNWLQEVSLMIIHHMSRKRDRHTTLIQQIVAYVRTNYQAPHSLKTLSYRFDISAPYLGRLFREETGESFPSWLNRLRIDKAEELMRTTGLTVTQIALKTGYPNPNYFYSLFKKHRGVNPGEYMNSLKKTNRSGE